jgi:flagellar biogenesis protein FliO
MKRALAILSLMSSLCPTLVSARAVEDVTLSADPADIVLTVSSDEALRAPTVRTYPGSVRIRFYDAHETPVLRLVGDGGAVRSVDVGNGSDNSAALVLMLGDRTRLAPTDVRVERDAGKVVFKIARGLLPALREGSPMPVSAKPLAAPRPAGPAQVIATAAAPQPVAAPAPAPVVQPAPVAPAAPAGPVAAKPAPVIAKPVATTLGAKQPSAAPAKKSELKLAQGGDSSAIPVLLAISALLALAYGVIRLLMRNKTVGDDIPVIDVVAQKRLGPRHQLVIVRAFDRDYLLSIQGGQTTVVARSSRKRVGAAEELLAPATKKRSTQPVNRDFEEDDEVTFGGELFKTALDQRERARDQTAGFRLEAARAEARAELSRLDAARDELVANRDAPRSSAVERELGLEAKLNENLDRELGFDRELGLGLDRELGLGAGALGIERDEARSNSESVPSGMSESVSGLLRLRKASGR